MVEHDERSAHSSDEHLLGTLLPSGFDFENRLYLIARLGQVHRFLEFRSLLFQ